MEPVTHILTGACLARTGLNRKAAYATLAMAVAAEFPDIDTLWGLRGPVAGFQHHRGITHTFLGIPFEAAFLVAGVYGFHRWRLRRIQARNSQPGVPELEARIGRSRHLLPEAPVRWGLLYGFTLLALLSHLWLDYTNNYGLRPFFPFNPRWYAASITFIFDPVMFALLLGALVLPPLFRLVGQEVGARRQPFVARGWAVAALLSVGGLWGWRALEHGRAEQIASSQSYSLAASAAVAETLCPPGADTACAEPPPTILQPQRVLSSPDPVNPFRWYSVVDFGPLYQLGTVDVRAGTFVPAQSPENKPPPGSALLAAERSPLGRAYLDWSPIPVLGVVSASRDMRPLADEPVPAARVVTFRDPRFLGDMFWLHTSGRSPLTGTVELDAQGHILRESMDGKMQR